MALFDNALGTLGETLLVGVGVAVVAPLILPVVRALIRPVAKEVIKGGFFLLDSLADAAPQEHRPKSALQGSELITGVQAEYHVGDYIPVFSSAQDERRNTCLVSSRIPRLS